MSDSPIDYKEIYFQHKTLTKITGLPTYKTLAKLAKNIIALHSVAKRLDVG
jgi:hypothetical protein